MSHLQQLDTTRHIATPEGCEISLQPAGPVARARAWLFDFLIRLGVWLLLLIVLRLSGGLGVGLIMLSAFLLEWFYPIIFEVYMQGQTPGKRLCKLKVLHDDGTPVGWGSAFIRNTVRFVDFMPLLYATAFITSLLEKNGKRLGDLAAGTLVVYTHGKPSLSNWDNGTGSETEAPPFPLKIAEQQAILEFSRRIRDFTEERAEELAQIAIPLTGDEPRGQKRLRLLRIANFLLGRH